MGTFHYVSCEEKKTLPFQEYIVKSATCNSKSAPLLTAPATACHLDVLPVTKMCCLPLKVLPATHGVLPASKSAILLPASTHLFCCLFL